MRRDFLQLESNWLTLARSFDLSIRLHDFTGNRERLREKYELELRESIMLRPVAPTMPDVFITQELDKRTPGKVDSVGEKIALQELATLMADEPEQVLPEFVSLAMELTGGTSAGLSLYEKNPAPGIFRWHHLQGTLAQFAGATTPRNHSPCGVVLDLNAPVLTAHSTRLRLDRRKEYLVTRGPIGAAP